MTLHELFWMAQARARHEWQMTALLAVPAYNSLRDPQMQRTPFALKDFYPWPRLVPELIRRIKPSELF